MESFASPAPPHPGYSISEDRVRYCRTYVLLNTEMIEISKPSLEQLNKTILIE